MPVNLRPTPESALALIPGVRIGTAQAGVRKAGRDDLTVLLLDAGTVVAGVFTNNRYCAAPVQLCRQHLSEAQPIRALVINTGNANAGMGRAGLAAARQVCLALAQHLAVRESAILPFSTGVIMEPLPFERIIDALPQALAQAQEGRGAPWGRAASAIMTTDTVPKAYSKTVHWQGQTLHVSGISKGAGMIRPDMATMLGFIATDAAIPAHVLPSVCKRIADASFNCITVDGDMSTNDSFVLMATGKVPLRCDDWSSAAAHGLIDALTDVACWLARAIVRDGEGATKLITIEVVGGKTLEECRLVGYAVAHSPLVKTAFYASDPNLGRVLAAVGYAGIADLEQSLISLALNGVAVIRAGERDPSFTEDIGTSIMQAAEITLRIDLARGAAQARIWTCDLSHDYVSINADYRS